MKVTKPHSGRGLGVYLARNEVELINPKVSGASFALLRGCRLREWLDRRGNWHVVVPARRLPEIEQAALRQRPPGGQRQPAPGHTFREELERATARLKQRMG